jgi:hypothetical protein
LQLSQLELSQVQVALVGGGAAPPPPLPPHAESVTRTNSMEIPVNTRLLVMVFPRLCRFVIIENFYARS